MYFASLLISPFGYLLSAQIYDSHVWDALQRSLIIVLLGIYQLIQYEDCLLQQIYEEATG